jgi:AraC-like DNA-binding protein
VAYREFRPPPELEPVVRCLWVRHSEADETVDVLPDGCVDIVVRDGRASVAGPDTRAAPTCVTAGQTIVGARFHPGAAAAALGVPAVELRDARVPLEAIWGRFAAELAERGSAGPGDLAAVLAERAGADTDRLVLAAATALERNPDTKVRDLSARSGVSERQLRRRCLHALGYGPKTYARIVRFKRMLLLVRAGEPLALAAAEAGYSDQPHMTREAQALGGRSPSALR